MKSLVVHKLNILKIWPTVVTNMTLGNLEAAKGQIKPKADWRAIDSPKKQTNERICFIFLLYSPEILET